MGTALLYIKFPLPVHKESRVDIYINNFCRKLFQRRGVGKADMTLGNFIIETHFNFSRYIQKYLN